MSLTHQTGMRRPCKCLLLLRPFFFSPAPLLSAHHKIVSNRGNTPHSTWR